MVSETVNINNKIVMFLFSVVVVVFKSSFQR